MERVKRICTNWRCQNIFLGQAVWGQNYNSCLAKTNVVTGSENLFLPRKRGTDQDIFLNFEEISSSITFYKKHLGGSAASEVR